MSEEDKESKTEPATEKKVRDAIEKGNLPISREVSLFASLLGMLAILVFQVRDGARALGQKLSLFLDDPGAFRLSSSEDAASLLHAVAFEVGTFLLPPMLVLAACGLAASMLQNLPRIVSERVRPQWSRVSPFKGAERIFGRQGLIEFAKSLFKIAAAGSVAAILLQSEQKRVVSAMVTDPSLIPELVLSIAVRLVSAISIATIVLVAADLVWARIRWQRDLRMSRQELKDELKQAEGDPLVKSRLRSLARDRSRRRMLAAVPGATVVIANPTHFAVALRYRRDEDGAPIVLAKGQDLIALKIREIAERHGVPVIEDKPLARSLYHVVEIDQPIPADFYRAVAQILFYVFSRPR